MSLLDNAFETFVLMEKARVDDGYGGVITKWTDGAEIKGALVLDDSHTAQIAQAMGVTSLYTLTVRRNLSLDFHDVIRRVSDGKYFRITNDSDERDTPFTAGLDMRQYSAEAWTL